MGKDDERIKSSDHFKESHSGCTDIPCCGIWILCLVALGAVFGYAYVNGNPRRFHHGIDHLGRVCGVDAGVENLPNTYFCPDPSQPSIGGSLAAGLMKNPVCVSICPLEGLGGIVKPAIVPECGNFSTVAYKTVDRMNYCFPDMAADAAAATEVGTSISGLVPTLMKAADSMAKGWHIYIIIFVLAIFMGYAYIFFLKLCAKPAIWTAIVFSFLALSGAAIWLIKNAETVGTNEVMQDNFGQFATKVSYVTGGLCAIASFGILCLVCCFHSKIDTAVIAVQMTTDVMAAMPSLLIAPVVKAIAKFIVALLMSLGGIYLLSVAKPTSIAGSAMARQFSYENSDYGMMFFFLFMFFWLMAFLSALYQFAIAYATADYYYADETSEKGGRDVGHCNVAEGLLVGLIHHQGSFALGSFIIACFSMIQAALTYINKSNPNNPVVKVITCVLNCIVTLCKKCIEYVNKNAYIGIAVKGYNFCEAALKAVEVMLKNAPQMAILCGATWIFQIVGLLAITAASLFIADFMITFPIFHDQQGKYFLPNPTLVVVGSGMVGFAIAKIFMDVFDMVGDTLMYCLCTDGDDPRNPQSRAPAALSHACAQASLQGEAVE